jgi:hypothetical protein
MTESEANEGDVRELLDKRVSCIGVWLSEGEAVDGYEKLGY